MFIYSSHKSVILHRPNEYHRYFNFYMSPLIVQLINYSAWYCVGRNSDYDEDSRNYKFKLPRTIFFFKSGERSKRFF
jgi:hypothetical protein